MPGRLVPSAPATHTWASTLRTPSVNTTQPAGGAAGAGHLGAHRSPGTSTSTSTWASLAVSCSSVPIAAPYSGAHASTAKVIRLPQYLLDDRRRRRFGHLEANRHPFGQIAHVGHHAHH